jgi:hypothetical protein
MNFIAKHIQAIGLLMLTGFVAAAAALYLDVPARVAKPSVAKVAANYSCPMHPEEVSSGPGDCHKCGMTLTSTAAAAAKPTGCNHATGVATDDSAAAAPGCGHAGGGCCSPKPDAATVATPAGGCTRDLVTPTDRPRS